MRRRVVFIALVASSTVASACLSTLPFDDLERDGPLPVDAGLEAPLDGATEADTETADTEPEADVETDAPDDAPDADPCKDKALNGDETDVDCGGGTCARCSSNRKCKSDADCVSGACVSGKCAYCPPGMVRVPVGVQAYCIDATEVTVAAYDAFASKTSPKDVTLHAACAWKASGSFAADDAVSFGDPDEPVRGVDWCDAWSYCASLEKRLCGAIGTSSSKPPTPFDKYDDPNVGQWRHACSYASSPAWPYGPSASSSKCNTAERGGDAGVAKVLEVRALPTCIGASPELNALYDMSGNVAEWEDSCSGATGESDACRVRGGSIREKASAAGCGAPTTRNRSDRQAWVGFRCCKY